MKIHKFKVLLILVMSISVLAVMFNILAALLLDGVTVDLTPDKTYSLSDVSKNMLKNNKEDIVIRFYVSDNLYGMKSELGLTDGIVKYSEVAKGCHFRNQEYPWEKLDKVEAIEDLYEEISE